MVENSAELDTVFHALAHPARRAMLGRLTGRPYTVGELAAPLEMSLAAASKHVKVLEDAGLLHRSVQGRQHLCRLTSQPLATASDWLSCYERFWTSRLDHLTEMLQPAADAGGHTGAGTGGHSGPGADSPTADDPQNTEDPS